MLRRPEDVEVDNAGKKEDGIKQPRPCGNCIVWPACSNACIELYTWVYYNSAKREFRLKTGIEITPEIDEQLFERCKQRGEETYNSVTR